MKIAVYASAAIFALGIGIGAASAEEKASELKNSPVAESAAIAASPIDQLDGVPAAIKMPAEELGEIVGGDPGCGPRRRWFHRKVMVEVLPCLPF